MGRSFQLTNIFALLTVLENVRVAIQSREGVGLNFWKHYLHFSSMEDEAYELLKSVLLEDKWAMPASSLTHGEQRKLESPSFWRSNPKSCFWMNLQAGMGQEEVPAILEILHRIKDAKTAPCFWLSTNGHDHDAFGQHRRASGRRTDRRRSSPMKYTAAGRFRKPIWVEVPGVNKDILMVEDVHTYIAQHHILQGVSFSSRPMP
jgi:hypothetical protein